MYKILSKPVTSPLPPQAPGKTKPQTDAEQSPKTAPCPKTHTEKLLERKATMIQKLIEKRPLFYMRDVVWAMDMNTRSRMAIIRVFEELEDKYAAMQELDQYERGVAFLEALLARLETEVEDYVYCQLMLAYDNVLVRFNRERAEHDLAHAIHCRGMGLLISLALETRKNRPPLVPVD